MEDIIKVSYEESEDVLKASFLKDDFSFDEKFVSTVLSTIFYVFSTGVEDSCKEQFAAQVLHLFKEELKIGRIEGKMEITDFE